MLYFAYGSNMNGDQMRARCPSAQAVGIARLDGFRLAITRRSTSRGCGVLGIVADERAVVWGVIYHIDDGEREALDRYEGYRPGGPRNAYQPMVVTVWRDGDPTWCLTVRTSEVVRKETNPLLPNAEYKRLSVTGAQRWGLPPAYIAQLEAVNVE